MSKTFGHTGTLFKQNGKYYKWSYKFTSCIECKTCNFKHKGRGLCTSCFDKERSKTPQRKKQLAKNGLKWHKKNYNPVIERKQREKTFNKEEYKKKWYQENKERISIENKGLRRFKNGLPCLKAIFGEKIVYFPFAELEVCKIGHAPNFAKYEKVRKFYEK